MQSRRDQVQAQSHLLGRLTAALVAGEPDGLETPHRRTTVGLLAGVLVAALVVGGFTLYGFFAPGGATAWRKAGSLVVEKETGSRYLYLDGRLRPVLNYASARLLLGEELAVVTVSAKSLRGVAHGQPLGIVGAPDVLPAGGLAGVGWTACAPSATDLAGTETTALTLSVAPAADGTPLAADRAVLVRPTGDPTAGYLIWNGQRFRLTAPWLPAVLGHDGPPVTVPAAWLDLVPAGVDLGPVAVPGRGEAGPEVDGQPTRIGQLFTARPADGAERHYLLRRDGLARLTPLAYALLAADPATVAGYGGRVVVPTVLSPAALARLPLVARPPVAEELPAVAPAAASRAAGLAWCLRFGADGRPRVVAARPVPATGIVRGGVGVTRTAHTADAVAVTPGRGGLVVTGRAGQPGTGYHLVTDAGVKYPLAGAAVAERLGYAPATATVVSPDLIDLLPTGPALDPARVVG
ncbi:type VII secretion protein EccB [Micromonospora humida]|uniref:Type VII secretion protein EccB n=3 Tax=Micromonospora humida TaxID=2809018 RepID=A0ABS2IML2_9ACTN|nr:type VII secretion protein EccB [Micromonospora humida]MBM7075249.1 type VII secretion protein EccB [Micromonospora humida]